MQHLWDHLVLFIWIYLSFQNTDSIMFYPIVIMLSVRAEGNFISGIIIITPEKLIKGLNYFSLD